MITTAKGNLDSSNEKAITQYDEYPPRDRNRNDKAMPQGRTENENRFSISHFDLWFWLLSIRGTGPYERGNAVAALQIDKWAIYHFK